MCAGGGEWEDYICLETLALPWHGSEVQGGETKVSQGGEQLFEPQGGEQNLPVRGGKGGGTNLKKSQKVTKNKKIF